MSASLIGLNLGERKPDGHTRWLSGPDGFLLKVPNRAACGLEEPATQG